MNRTKELVLEFIRQQRTAGKSYRKIALELNGTITFATVRNMELGLYGTREKTLDRLERWFADKGGAADE